MGSLHSEAAPAAQQPAEGIPPTPTPTSGDDSNKGRSTDGAESINQKCRVLSEKLDQLLSTLHEEAAPPGTDQAVSTDDSSDPSVQDVDPSSVHIKRQLVLK